MTDKMKIVWIGEKDLKKVNRQGRDYFFPRGQVVSVPEHIGYDLLQLVTCFALPDTADKLIAKQKEEQEKHDLLQAEAIKAKELEDASKTWRVFIDGDVCNISKYSKAKLETVIVSEDLNIDPLDIDAPIGVTAAEALRMAVRDALHVKSGNPELQES